MPTDKQIFALDIGTRTVVGLVMERRENAYHINAAHIEQHQSRAMYQGQIHDIAAVAKSVRKVKKALENKLSCQLKTAAVAAAGRSLITKKGCAEQTLSPHKPIESPQLSSLQLEAVHGALSKLTTSEAADRYLCVGYTVFHYLLDGEPITNPIGQQGRKISAKVIATFLPQVVINSLIAVLKAADLDIFTLTLEPIAALNVALEPGMMNLNLALIDVGAGTSDIALCRSGTVFAYAMLPQAGDMITEALCRDYLLDFNTGEKVKKHLRTKTQVKITDILGAKHQLSTEEIISALKPTVGKLADKIATLVLHLNQSVPDGVILIGGGSLTPNLSQHLAAALNLSPRRVGVKESRSLSQFSGFPRRLSGPMAVTPLGIGTWALSQHPFMYKKVTVNQEPVRLWNLGEITVADALIAAGNQWQRLEGRRGKMLTLELNGQVKLIPGTPGKPAQIFLNGQKTKLEAIVSDGDQLTILPPEDGTDGRVTLRGLLPKTRPSVYLNGQAIGLQPQLYLNGQPANDLDTPVPDKTRVEILYRRKISDILAEQGIKPAEYGEKIFSYTLNGRKHELPWPNYKLEKNNRPALPENSVGADDRIVYQEIPPAPRLKDILPVPEEEEITITLNGKGFTLPIKPLITLNGQPANGETPLSPEAIIELRKAKTPLLADLFSFFDPLTLGQGKRLILEVNNQPAGYTTPLFSGADVNIYWDGTGAPDRQAPEEKK
jgi:cell division protein FtsA